MRVVGGWVALVVVVCASTSAALAGRDAGVDSPPSCRDPRYLHSFDPSLRAGDCAQVGTVSIRTAKDSRDVRVIRLATTTVDTSQAMTELQDLATRVASALDAMRVDQPEVTDVHHATPHSDDPVLALPKSITILLDTAPPVAETRAASWHLRYSNDDCTIAYHFQSTQPRKLFQVAHELFHCIQASEWDDARLSARDANWWAEGSAELFGSIVYGGSGLTDGDAAAFQANEHAVLIDRSFDAVVFFDWFFAQKGPKKLYALLDGVHATAGTGTLSALRDAVKDSWVSFEEAYYDHHIYEFGGRALPFSDSPEPPVTRIESSGAKTFSADPFVVERAIVEFAKGKKYKLDRTGQSDKITMQWSVKVGDAWIDPPDTVHACEKKRFRAVVGTVESHETVRVRVEAKDDRECSCVVGSWQQTSDSLARASQRLSARGVHTQCSYTGGGTQLTLNADHSGADNYQGLVMQCTGRANSTATSNGALSFTWTVTDDQLALASTGSTATTHVVMTVRGKTITQDVPMPSAGSTAHFTCEHDHLHLDYGSDGFDYTRVSGP